MESITAFDFINYSLWRWAKVVSFFLIRRDRRLNVSKMQISLINICFCAHRIGGVRISFVMHELQKCQFKVKLNPNLFFFRINFYAPTARKNIRPKLVFRRWSRPDNALVCAHSSSTHQHVQRTQVRVDNIHFFAF